MDAHVRGPGCAYLCPDRHALLLCVTIPHAHTTNTHTQRAFNLAVFGNEEGAPEKVKAASKRKTDDPEAKVGRLKGGWRVLGWVQGLLEGRFCVAVMLRPRL